MATKPKVGVLVMALLEDDYNKTVHMRPAAQKAADRIIDSLKVGRGIGSVLPEAIKETGALGTLLNHAEKKLT